jgi:hypothetical protein
MARARRTDVLFAGAAVAPLTLALAAQPGAAVLLFVPLLLAACLHGAWEDAATIPRARVARRAGARDRLRGPVAGSCR